MSENNDVVKAPVVRTTARVDRRILRTRDALGDALISLIQEKSFDEVTVQEVLDRAGIGRSTFYAHYSDKDDLFFSDVEDFFGLMATLLNRQGAAVERVAPVRELFAHVSEARGLRAALVASGRMHEVLELGRGIFAASIEQRLVVAGAEIEPSLLKPHAHALAGSLFALLDWWLDHAMTMQPEEVDALFHRMVWTGVRPRIS